MIPSNDNDSRQAVNASVNAFSRVIAVLVLMVVPGIVGYFIDKSIGTSFCIVIGFILGMILACFGLILVARRADAELKKNKS